jgi:hypothetical protein
MEGVLYNFAKCYTANPLNTSAIMAIPESDYQRFPGLMWKWTTFRTYKTNHMIFNQYEKGELPRKCGMSTPYRMMFWKPLLV